MGSDVREMIFENREKFDSGGEDLRVAFAATTTQTPNTTTSGGADNGNKKTPPTKKPIETFCAHPSLTLLLPALFARFENLTTLRLDLYQFRSLADLLRLVGSLPKLHTLGCHRLSWKHMPPALTGGGGYAYGSRRGTMWAPLRSLTVTRCPSVWPMLHFFDAGSSNSRRGRTLLPVQSTSGSSSTSKDTLAVSKIPPFPGLDSAEAQVIVEIGTLYGLGSSSVNPDLEVKCKWSGSTKRWILRICDIYHIHELQFHLSVSDSKVPHTTVSANNINPSPARIREIIFVSHSGLHRTGDIVPEEVGVLLSRLVYLDRIVFDAAWDSEAEEEALEGLGGELREKTEVVLGGELSVSL
ncbi:hypothetical protein BDY19DRAFT_428143 [Irpex rosettiformis]|uniref:Uncharacterized protein n=1 Tax=Irpex rosettiformis TaxID=378272 RepID=A0ACB8UGR4_9APHY|nr:hypothetical protein BDY19DRAFT_428143 [Irpex rosettiformis]